MNTKDKNNQHIVDILFVIALFCIFVLSAIFLISIGATIYSKTMSNMSSNFDSRTAVAYIVEKVHQSDEAGNVSIGEFNGQKALIISSYSAGREYKTYIYEFEGELKELMSRADVTLSCEAGQPIIKVDSFTIENVCDDLIKCHIDMPDDKNYTFYVTLHSDEGGQNDES